MQAGLVCTQVCAGHWGYTSAAATTHELTLHEYELMLNR